MFATQQPHEAYQAHSGTSPSGRYQPSDSSSPSRSRSSTRARGTLGDKINALGAKLSRTLGHASVGEDDNSDPSATATPDDSSSIYSNGEPKYTGRYTGRGSFSLTRQRTADSDVSGATAVVVGSGDRSVSRGRETYSTGRGGAGNIRQQPLSAPASANGNGRAGLGPDDFSVTRGREPVPFRSARGVSPSPNGVYSTGRGGAGNLRSPSRDAERAAVNAGVAQDKQVIRDYVEKQMHEGTAYSTGRGGAGNITSRSRSKSQTRDSPRAAVRTPYTPYVSHAPHPPQPQIFSTGRGGAGNIVQGDGAAAEVFDAEERRRMALLSGSSTAPAQNYQFHSTGRGGGGNITAQPVPPVESLAYAFEKDRDAERGRGGFESHGRGGAGNIAARGQVPAQTRRSGSQARG